MSVFGGRIQPIDATPLRSGLAPWNGMHMEGHAPTWFMPRLKAEPCALKEPPIDGEHHLSAIEEREWYLISLPSMKKSLQHHDRKRSSEGVASTD
jgi:hypothetical protein